MRDRVSPSQRYAGFHEVEPGGWEPADCDSIRFLLPSDVQIRDRSNNTWMCSTPVYDRRSETGVVILVTPLRARVHLDGVSRARIAGPSVTEHPDVTTERPVIRRDPRRARPTRVGGEDVYPFDDIGQRCLDGSGGCAAVTSISHGASEGVEVISRQAATLAQCTNPRVHDTTDRGLRPVSRRAVRCGGVR